MLGLSSLYGTSTVSLTLVASTDSTALFTSVVSNCSGGCAGVPAAGLGSASHGSDVAAVVGCAVVRGGACGHDGPLAQRRRWYATPARPRQGRRSASGSRRRRPGRNPASPLAVGSRPEHCVCRAGGIRTRDLSVPNRARYQPAPQPVTR